LSTAWPELALLFAYGTLQDVAQLQAVIGATAPVHVLGHGCVHGALFDVGAYPALRFGEPDGAAVPGVLFELDDAALAPLDRYEGVDEGLYVRTQACVHLADGGAHAAWVYTYARPLAGARRIRAWPVRRGAVGGEHGRE
jgi:gamma-glutamylcyclotransferase (GGCT)/AIG2-like uncharacterized protein YtfP